MTIEDTLRAAEQHAFDANDVPTKLALADLRRQLAWHPMSEMATEGDPERSVEYRAYTTSSIAPHWGRGHFSHEAYWRDVLPGPDEAGKSHPSNDYQQVEAELKTLKGDLHEFVRSVETAEFKTPECRELGDAFAGFVLVATGSPVVVVR